MHLWEHVNDFRLTHRTTPLCSGMFGCWVDIPARKQVEPRRLAQRTLTKSLGPTTLPGVSADSSWVTNVSSPIFWRIWWIPMGNLATLLLRSFSVWNVSYAGLSHLDLLDIWVPLPHLLHVSHQLFIKTVRMLLQHHFQLEHLPNVRQHFTQHFVSVSLRRIVNKYWKNALLKFEK